MAKPVIRTPYDGLGSTDAGVACTAQESKTLQSHQEYCDIEKQIKALAPGYLPGSNAKAPVYADLSDTPTSILEAHERMERFKSDFAQHSPEIRLRFDNKPTKMVEFLLDPANMEESYKLGLRKKPIVEPPPVDNKAILKETIRQVLAESTAKPTDGEPAK